MKTLYFVRATNEYRMVWIHNDGSYQIRAMNSGLLSKRHNDDFTQYYHHMVANGWRKATYDEYLKAKWSSVVKEKSA